MGNILPMGEGLWIWNQQLYLFEDDCDYLHIEHHKVQWIAFFSSKEFSFSLENEYLNLLEGVFLPVVWRTDCFRRVRIQSVLVPSFVSSPTHYDVLMTIGLNYSMYVLGRIR